MTTRLFAMIGLLAVLVAGCAPKAAAPEYAAPYEADSFAPSVGLVEESKAGYGVLSTGDVASNVEPIDAERMVVKNASLTMAVDDPQASLDRIARLAEGMGGFVVSANVYQMTLSSGVEVPRASITIRVPAEKLIEALAQIRAETRQPVISENITSQDITATYTNLEARLRNLEAAEKQLQGIMEKATRTQDVLDVFNQLTQVREQIEVIKGQMKYYAESAALSAISVELMANAAVQPLTIGRWQPVGVAKDALQALINTLRVLVNIAIWLVLMVIPVLVIVLAPPYLVVRFFLRRRAKRRAMVKPGTPTEQA